MAENPINPNLLAEAVAKILRNAAALLVALGVLGGFLWWAFEPRVRDWLDARDAPTRVKLATIEASLSRIESRMNGIRPADFIEFIGIGHVLDTGPFTPGGTVRVAYQLRRTRGCQTTVEVRFVAAATGVIDSAVSYSIEATRAPITEEFTGFAVNVRLPRDMRPGRYAYAPLLVPLDCPDQQPVVVPMSEFFAVVTQ